MSTARKGRYLRAYLRHPFRYRRIQRLLTDYQTNGAALDLSAGQLYTILYGTKGHSK